MGESVREMAPEMMTSAARSAACAPAACPDVAGAGAEIMTVGHAPILAATGAALLRERHAHLVTSTRGTKFALLPRGVQSLFPTVSPERRALMLELLPEYGDLRCLDRQAGPRPASLA
ncbi:hypothetical protein GCM10011504_39680 [Siccirubricoccus deserti]|nr:hypothetical protein GCM10011504_39680 [Siccirubricoccus deserti]